MVVTVVSQLAVRAGASLVQHRDWRGTRRRIDRHDARVARDHRGPASRLGPGGRPRPRERDCCNRVARRPTWLPNGMVCGTWLVELESRGAGQAPLRSPGWGDWRLDRW